MKFSLRVLLGWGIQLLATAMGCGFKKERRVSFFQVFDLQYMLYLAGNPIHCLHPFPRQTYKLPKMLDFWFFLEKKKMTWLFMKE
jgi:hypothetical protein